MKKLMILFFAVIFLIMFSFSVKADCLSGGYGCRTCCSDDCGCVSPDRAYFDIWSSGYTERDCCPGSYCAVITDGEKTAGCWNPDSVEDACYAAGGYSWTEGECIGDDPGEEQYCGDGKARWYHNSGTKTPSFIYTSSNNDDTEVISCSNKGGKWGCASDNYCCLGYNTGYFTSYFHIPEKVILNKGYLIGQADDVAWVKIFSAKNEDDMVCYLGKITLGSYKDLNECTLNPGWYMFHVALSDSGGHDDWFFIKNKNAKSDSTIQALFGFDGLNKDGPLDCVDDSEYGLYECTDGIDNDANDRVDGNDPNCLSSLECYEDNADDGNKQWNIYNTHVESTSYNDFKRNYFDLNNIESKFSYQGCINPIDDHLHTVKFLPSFEVNNDEFAVYFTTYVYSKQEQTIDVEIFNNDYALIKVFKKSGSGFNKNYDTIIPYSGSAVERSLEFEEGWNKIEVVVLEADGTSRVNGPGKISIDLVSGYLSDYFTLMSNTLDVSENQVPNGCIDGIDNDEDDDIDCLDEDCNGKVGPDGCDCQYGSEWGSGCIDGCDNDGDVVFDGSDPDCELEDGGICVDGNSWVWESVPFIDGLYQKPCCGGSDLREFYSATKSSSVGREKVEFLISHLTDSCCENEGDEDVKDCVYNHRCYNDGEAHSLISQFTPDAYCNNGKWYDCDTSEAYCNTCASKVSGGSSIIRTYVEEDADSSDNFVKVESNSGFRVGDDVMILAELACIGCSEIIKCQSCIISSLQGTDKIYFNTPLSECCDLEYYDVTTSDTVKTTRGESSISYVPGGEVIEAPLDYNRQVFSDSSRCSAIDDRNRKCNEFCEYGGYSKDADKCEGDSYVCYCLAIRGYEYNELGDEGCCGDDRGEFIVESDGVTACCDNPDDCVWTKGGFSYCQDGGTETSDGGTCVDGIDNDCDGLVDRADTDCGVEVLGVSVSDEEPYESSYIDVMCEASEGDVNCIQAWIDKNDNGVRDLKENCKWKDGGWNGNIATFPDCNVGHYGGTKKVECFVNESCYIIGDPVSMEINVQPNPCSVYEIEDDCSGSTVTVMSGSGSYNSANCVWCEECYGNKYTGVDGGGCVLENQCIATCDTTSTCGATCDATEVGCPAYTELGSYYYKEDGCGLDGKDGCCDLEETCGCVYEVCDDCDGNLECDSEQDDTDGDGTIDACDECPNEGNLTVREEITETKCNDGIDNDCDGDIDGDDDNCCVITLASLTQNCDASNVNCEEGETIDFYAETRGECDYVNYLQIDASDTTCKIQHNEDADALGDDTDIISGGIGGLVNVDIDGKVSGSWTIPTVPELCAGVLIYPDAAGLYKDGPPDQGSLVTKITDVEGSFRFANNCGDGVVGFGETCDTDTMPVSSCTELSDSFTEGDISCYAPGLQNECHYDTSACVDGEGECGDTEVNPGEECDTTVGGKDCTDFGFKAGDLSCENCFFDTSDCTHCGILCDEIGGVKVWKDECEGVWREDEYCTHCPSDFGKCCTLNSVNVSSFNCSVGGCRVGDVVKSVINYNTISCYLAGWNKSIDIELEGDGVCEYQIQENFDADSPVSVKTEITDVPDYCEGVFVNPISATLLFKNQGGQENSHKPTTQELNGGFRFLATCVGGGYSCCLPGDGLYHHDLAHDTDCPTGYQCWEECESTEDGGCVLEKAYWNNENKIIDDINDSIVVAAGNPVYLFVEGNNCAAEELELMFYEFDGSNRTNDTLLDEDWYGWPEIKFNEDGNIAAGGWTAKWFPDEPEPGDEDNINPEILFRTMFSNQFLYSENGIMVTEAEVDYDGIVCGNGIPESGEECEIVSTRQDCGEDFKCVRCECVREDTDEDGHIIYKKALECIDDNDDGYGTRQILILDENGDPIGTPEEEPCVVLPESVPFFDWINLLMVVAILIFYYSRKRKR